MERCLIPDIYFDPRYGKTCELIEAGEARTFEYASEQGRSIHSLIQRPIDTTIGGDTRVDLAAPHG